MASSTVQEPELSGGKVEIGEVAVAPSNAAKRAARKTAPLRGGRRRTGAARRSTAVLSLLLVAFVAATAFFGYHYFADASGASDGERTQVTAVANDYATKLASFDYRDLNKNREAIKAMSTQQFAAKYDEMVKALTEIVANGQGVATAKVSHSAVQAIDGDTATVIAFVDQKATNVVAPEGKDQSYRMVLSLKRDGDRWLVEDVQTV
ncbi:MAG: hypothetical protein WBA98_13095 [Gordonia sp. (in: high G+C Gram-positive bacteria)]|uniref:hypothetical protein n=1 Tax=Gordonia sp. (in: high G+C Gram-positive bacteria) TaxID=84139 RepID=UPI003C76A09F